MKQAFCARTGFLAVWCDYAESIAWVPTVLSFIAASLAYAIDPALATNNAFLVIVVLVFLWGTTAANLGGVRVVGHRRDRHRGRLDRSRADGGRPGTAFLLQGNPSQIPFSASALVPDIQLNLAFLGGVILLFTDMEMTGFHARDPGRTVPRAIALRSA